MPRLLVDDDVELSPLTLADTEELYLRVAQSREHLSRYLPWAPNATLSGTRAFIEQAERRRADGDGFDLAVRERGRIVGGIGLHHVDRLNLATSLGYWLAADAQGRGLMRRAVDALLRHCFGELQLHRVEIRVAPTNERSLALVRRLGAREEGRLREAALLRGEWHDLLVFSLLSHEWLSAAPPAAPRG